VVISAPDEMPTCVSHADLVAQYTQVDIGQTSQLTLVTELVAALSNPGGGFGEFGR
jgi:hypothetical protein